MVTRRTGYRLSVGKEEPALAAAEEFFERVVGVRVEHITDAQENYEFGDFRAPSGVTIECKGQPIDPAKYKQNFVEIFEVTENERHRSGLTEVAGLLGLDSAQVERIPVRIKGRGVPTPLGRPDFVSVSIRSMTTSGWTIYVNVKGGHIYLYGRNELMDHLRSAVPAGLARGAGMSNEDTFAIFIPLADRRWNRDLDGSWKWTGNGSESRAVDSVRSSLS